MESIKNKKTSDYIAEQIANEILAGRIAGNVPLRQEELAETLGASRIPIREALQILELQGLTVRLATRHIVTVDFSDRKIKELYRMIADIEKNVLESIYEEGGAAQLKKAIEADTEIEEEEFHQLICRHANNEYLQNLLQNAITYYIHFAIGCSGYRLDKLEQMKNQLVADKGNRQEMWQPYYDELADCVVTERKKNQ